MSFASGPIQALVDSNSPLCEPTCLREESAIKILFPPLLLLIPVWLAAQTETSTFTQDTIDGKPRLTIPRVEKPPSLEDYLPGGSRPGIAVTNFLQREPGDLTPAS